MSMTEPEVLSLRGTSYIRQDLVLHDLTGGILVRGDGSLEVRSVFDELDFWGAVDRDRLANLPSDPVEALEQMARSCEPHEVFWLQFADDGSTIRKWSRLPFDGARACRVGMPKRGGVCQTGANT